MDTVMTFQAKMILDSITTDGIRLITFELTYPLIVHNELLTHRTLGRSDNEEFEYWLEASRNSASNRAMPPAKIRQAVLDDPYIPTFVQATKGMIGGDVLSETGQLHSKYGWLKARDAAIKWFDYYDTLPIRIHKQHRNRLLTPFQWITTVATANEQWWQHFFELRDHEAAQPDIQHIAAMAHGLYKVSDPVVRYNGEWHLPYVTWEYYAIGNVTLDQAIRSSVANVARSSYLRQGELFTIEEDNDLYDRLYTARPPHASPFEHVAQAGSKDIHSGNFYGWYQYRKILGM